MKKLFLLLLIPIFLLTAAYDWDYNKKNKWYKTWDQVQELYKKHYNREKHIHLQNYIHKMEDGKYLANIQIYSEEGAQYIKISPSFIQHILDHMESAIEKGWINYIFWPDCNHGHLCMPSKYWINNYSNYTDSSHEYMTYMIEKDYKKMVILYHAAEHFSHNDPACSYAIKTRNVLGWFDGRPIKLTHPRIDDNELRKKANTADDPIGYDRKWFINITAGKYGYFSIYPNGKEIRINISFGCMDNYDTTRELKNLFDIF